MRLGRRAQGLDRRRAENSPRVQIEAAGANLTCELGLVSIALDYGLYFSPCSGVIDNTLLAVCVLESVGSFFYPESFGVSCSLKKTKTFIVQSE